MPIAEFGLLYWASAVDQSFALLVSLFVVADLLSVITGAVVSNCRRMKELIGVEFVISSVKKAWRMDGVRAFCAP